MTSPLPFASTGLPVEEILPELLSALEDPGIAVLSAEPGAGKTTLVPPSLLSAPWLRQRRILMLQPRRVAAQASARRIADLLGEAVGRTSGYRIALESRVSESTRIEIITEGILTRMIQDDPELPGVGALIFDEFHERSLHADLGLALALEIRESLRPDLRILVMSATIDTEALARLMSPPDGDTVVPVIRSKGRTYPVEASYAPPPAGSDFWKSSRQFASFAARTIAAIDKPGDVLVFMPGRREVRDVETLLGEMMAKDIAGGLEIATLSGDMDSRSQAALVRNRSEGRRIIVATSLAETSLTIPGIAVVVDSGLARFNRLDPHTGMDRLVTERVSLAASLQRQGRAGRLGPGFCIKLWDRNERLAAFLPPEIERGDMSSFVLETAAWGKSSTGGLRLLSPPGAGPLAQARRILRDLGALATDGAGDTITPHGREMARMGMHPRAAHVVARSRELPAPGAAMPTAAESGQTAATATVVVAAAISCAVLVDESDALWGRGELDPESLLRELWRGSTPELARARLRLAKLAKSAGIALPASDLVEAAALLPGCFAAAFPDRLAQLKDRSRDASVYKLTTGRLAQSRLNGSPAEWLVVLDADAGSETARIHSAFALSADDVRNLTEGLASHSEIEWDGLRPRSFVRRAIGKIVFEERVQALANVERAILYESFRGLLASGGLELLPWSERSTAFLRRVRYVSGVLQPAGPEDSGRSVFRMPPDILPWPQSDDASLIENAGSWLFPALNTKGGPVIDDVGLSQALEQLLTWKQLQWLENEVPTRLKTPAGSSRPVDYPALGGEAPGFSARIQEIFGMTAQPRVLGRPVRLHLLSPANRPLQITEDLESFWKNTYPEIRKEMRGRYPRHYWPDDPLQAEATSRAKPRGT